MRPCVQLGAALSWKIEGAQGGGVSCLGVSSLAARARHAAHLHTSSHTFGPTRVWPHPRLAPTIFGSTHVWPQPRLAPPTFGPRSLWCSRPTWEGSSRVRLADCAPADWRRACRLPPGGLPAQANLLLLRCVNFACERTPATIWCAGLPGLSLQLVCLLCHSLQLVCLLCPAPRLQSAACSARWEGRWGRPPCARCWSRWSPQVSGRLSKACVFRLQVHRRCIAGA